MNAKQFAAALREEVVEANLTTYHQLFAQTSAAEATDTYWKAALALYAQLDERQRETLFGILRQVMVDTTSNILAILDGASRLENETEELSLMCGDERISGDLQDVFLELEERE